MTLASCQQLHTKTVIMKKNIVFYSKPGILLFCFTLCCIFGFTILKPDDEEPELRIVVYEGTNFSSSHSELRKSLRNLKYIGRNDDISSVVVDKGTIAKFYRGPDYSACAFEIVGPFRVPKLDEYNCGCCSENSNGWDNEISSVELYPNSNERSPGIHGDFSDPQRPYPYNMDN